MIRIVFTGIVERTGTVVEMLQQPVGCRIRVETHFGSEDIPIGGSVAVNGCCLTVVESKGGIQTFEAGNETLSKTNLGSLTAGALVNLERGMRLDGRLDGHLVTGHVDAVGVLVERVDDHNWSTFWFEVPQELTRQMAAKGSVTVNGVSLTLVDVEDTRFSIALIPHTLQVTNLGQLQLGDLVNVETDLLAKYIERQLRAVGTI
ncbi:MAG TPA: riboflavin synthase [Pirellulaceae bacterium]|nr:riboflavin synthase [Pirellulaceae bacterium]HMP69563.1 riboflavin synthase [Pirellulaceae bacterium]